ncbi:MAG: N-acetyltransferase [Gemmatimonadales bacterium]|nr:N-acetyltransferase [Gemmatimonadales bacterium]
MQIDHDTEAHRFQVQLPAGTAILAYTPSGEKTLEMYSTYVPVAARGQGVAAALVEAALAYARAGGYRVIPSCWYVALWIRRHPEHADLLAA